MAVGVKSDEVEMVRGDSTEAKRRWQRAMVVIYSRRQA